MRGRNGRPSTYALRILASVHFGLAPKAWVRKPFELSGYLSALQACLDRGLLTAEHQLTDYGRRMLRVHGQGKTDATA